LSNALFSDAQSPHAATGIATASQAKMASDPGLFGKGIRLLLSIVNEAHS
jgi:hypothetical protein